MRKLLKASLILGGIALALVSCDNNSMAPQPPAGNTGLMALAGVPTVATVDSAWVAVHVSQFDTQTVTVHPVLNPWTETGLTFNSFPNWDTADTVAVLNISDTGWITFPVTNLVAGWLTGSLDNFGLAFRRSDTAAGFAQYGSREAVGFEPYLRICYTFNTDTLCEIFAATADTYIDETAPDVNYGTAAALYTGRDTAAASYRWTFIQFDFPVFTPPAVLGDFVWFDKNNNGLQDEGELGVPDVTIFLYECEGDTLVATTVTQESGFYWFDSLMPGSYYIALTPPSGLRFTMPDQGEDNAFDSDIDPATGRSECVTLDPAEQYHKLDVGFVLAFASVGDFVWNDLNMNGLQDMGEPGLEGITVNLYTCDHHFVATTMTGADGLYLFDQVEPGDYYLQFVNPFGWIFTYPNVGDNDAVDSDVDRYRKVTACFYLEGGYEDYSWDAGLFEFDGCTYSKGYWKNHDGLGPQGDVVTPLLPIFLGDEGSEATIVVRDAQTSHDILQQHTYGHPSNGITKLYAQLLAAKLNIANFANPEEVWETIEAADAFLAQYDWTDWDMLSKDQQKMVLRWKNTLDKFNNGYIGPGHCDEYGDADHDDGDCDDDDDDGGDDD